MWLLGSAMLCSMSVVDLGGNYENQLCSVQSSHCSLLTDDIPVTPQH